MSNLTSTIDPRYDPKRERKYKSGNEGRRHPTLVHPGYFQKRQAIRDGKGMR